MAGGHFDVSFGDYNGAKRFFVSHPSHADTPTVAAPDEDSAMVAAADWWGERWQDISYYAYVKVWRA